MRLSLSCCSRASLPTLAMPLVLLLLLLLLLLRFLLLLLLPLGGRLHLLPSPLPLCCRH